MFHKTVGVREPSFHRSIILFIIALVLAGYVFFVASKSTYFAELWLLDGILIQTVLTLIVLLFLSFLYFKRNIIMACTFYSIIAVSLIFITPIIKYPNSIGILFPWDSLAHYSFSKWIINYGRVPVNDELCYSKPYGFHPGNGIIPATLSLVTSIPLGFSINLILVTTYASYIVMWYLILRILKLASFINRNTSGSQIFLYLLVMVSFSIMYFPPYYTGTTITYIHVSLIFYCMLKIILRHEISSDVGAQKTILIFLIAYFGLLVNHFSTATIITLFLILVILLSPLVHLIRRKTDWGETITMLTTSFVIYATYELFVDVLPFSGTLSSAIKTLHTLYIVEMIYFSRASEIHPYLSLFDFGRYLLASYTKILMLLAIVILQTFVKLFTLHYNKGKSKGGNSLLERRLLILQSSALLVSLAGYIGTGMLIGLWRTSGLLQILISANLMLVLLPKAYISHSVSFKKRNIAIYKKTALDVLKKLSLGILLVSIIIFNIFPIMDFIHLLQNLELMENHIGFPVPYFFQSSQL